MPLSARVWVLGTFDQPVQALFDVDLMRWLAGAGVPVAGVVFKRSIDEQNPRLPTLCEPRADGRMCLHVRNFNDEDTVAHLQAIGPDLLVYAGGRDILRRPLLRVAPLGCLGGHYGQLPAIRGMGTVEWSVILGVPPTVAIQRISPGIDTGDVLLQARVPLVAGDTFASIRDRSYFLTKTLLALAARRILDGELVGTPQPTAAGRQYYRLHPALQRHADHALRRLLAARASETAIDTRDVRNPPMITATGNSTALASRACTA
jgi:methionyl-tRNA formyltransferase